MMLYSMLNVDFRVHLKSASRLEACRQHLTTPPTLPKWRLLAFGPMLAERGERDD